jgi:hypothetical protein
MGQRVVPEWATRHRRAQQVNIEGLTRVPSARTVARLTTMARDTLSHTQTATVAAIEAAVPTLVQAREIVDAFHTLIRRKQEAALDGWLEMAAFSLAAPFARGLARDHRPFGRRAGPRRRRNAAAPSSSSASSATVATKGRG